jgi:hypothetical protein
MRAWALLFLVIAIPTTLLASRYSNRPTHVIRSFHAGPGCNGYSQGYVFVEDSVATHECDGPGETGSWKSVRTCPCRDAWHVYGAYCPLYDDSEIVNAYDFSTQWPGKHESSWMQELAR